MYLTVKNASQKWTMPIQNWGTAMNQFEAGYQQTAFNILPSFPCPDSALYRL
jgi:transposase-like protein